MANRDGSGVPRHPHLEEPDPRFFVDASIMKGSVGSISSEGVAGQPAIFLRIYTVSPEMVESQLPGTSGPLRPDASTMHVLSKENALELAALLKTRAEEL